MFMKNKNHFLFCLFFILFSTAGCSNGKDVSAKNTSAPGDGSGGGIQTPNPGVDEKTGQMFFPDYFNNVTPEAATAVDDYMGHDELMKPRPKVSLHSTDSCDSTISGRSRFADRISYQIYLQSYRTLVPGIQGLGKVYGWSGNKNLMKNSLMSHKMCEVSQSTLEKTLGASKVPSASTISKINRFTQVMNADLALMKAGNISTRARYFRNWNKMMMCLAYHESLTTADSQDSTHVAEKHVPEFKKPSGVEFYEDDLQPETSSLNIGLYQFTPKSTGNVYPCLESWNTYYGNSCGVKKTATDQQMIYMLGSGHQSFNAFCGVNKVVQMFSIQINTEKPLNTHPNNVLANGQLKSAEDRCVSPFFSARLSYNHFGPLQNSYGNRLEKLMECVDSTLEGL